MLIDLRVSENTLFAGHFVLTHRTDIKLQYPAFNIDKVYFQNQQT